MRLYPRLYQDVRQNQLDECCQGLSKLLQDQLFLTSMVHALEEQKSFTIKDKSVSRSAVAPPSRLCRLSASPPPQVRVSLVADSSAPQQVVVPDGRDGGPAEGPDATEQECSAQTVAAAHRVHCGEAPDQLDVHLPLRLPPGKSPSLEVTVGHQSWLGGV